MTNIRCEKLAEYMLANNATLREAAKVFGVSKTTVHIEVTERLRDINVGLYEDVQQLLSANWGDKARRGGLACAKKYPDLHKRLKPSKSSA